MTLATAVGADMASANAGAIAGAIAVANAKAPASWPSGETALRVGFAGTPAFAAKALAAIWDAGHTVPLVLTQPDRPAGRGLQLQASEVKKLALALPVGRMQPVLAQPRSLRLDGKFAGDAAQAQAAIVAARLDVLVVAAYGLILPQWVLGAPRLGCLNIHGSLLPRWRGAAPIHRAIEAGDAQTGITIMQMDAGLDTGDMLLVEAVAIAVQDTTATLHDKMAALGARLCVQALSQAAAGELRPKPQPVVGVSYAHKIEKSEAPLDWRLPAAQIERRVRAFDPFPGATAELDGEVLKIFNCYEINSTKTPWMLDKGHIFTESAASMLVQTGSGLLAIGQLQRAGGKRVTAAEFLRGKDLPRGAHFALQTLPPRTV